MSAAGNDAAIARRVERLREALAEQGVDILLVDEEIDLRYLTGFTGSNGMALVSADPGGPLRFLTDFRYTAQSEEEVGEAFARQTVAGELYEALGGLLGPEPGRLGFDEAKLTVRGHARLAGVMGEGWELVRCKGLFEGLRAVKEPAEIALIADACRLADEALSETLEEGLVGRTERQVAFELETRMRRMGAEAPSFPSIVAFGEHGALPHAQPRDLEIPPDVLVTIDWGAVLKGYCSDCTRTYATGDSISDRAREVYELVLAAQEAGLAAVRPGRNGREIDAVARDMIDAAGEGANFGHGLGHGVGMEVHEAPRLSRTAGDEPLVEGNIVTVEPGVYLPGVLGVRIEDLVVVRSEGPEVLTTGLGKALSVVG
jgi:Xaa-Pro aminopeptidase